MTAISIVVPLLVVVLPLVAAVGASVAAIRRSVYLHELRIGSLRRGNFDLLSAACVGLAACTTTALGAWLATIVDPAVAAGSEGGRASLGDGMVLLTGAARHADRDAPRGGVTTFCVEHAISRKTFYAIRNRAIVEGQAAALEPRSRRPKTSRTTIADEVKKQGCWGAGRDLRRPRHHPR